MLYRPWQNPWCAQGLGLLALLLLAAALALGFRHMQTYARTVVTHNGAPPLRRVVLVDPPSWLSAPLLNAIAEETVHFALNNKRHPERAAELRNPLDGRILQQIARHYVRRPAVGENAWIKAVTYVRRVVRGGQQQIQIAAVYRRPAAVIQRGDHYFLITAHACRLPGMYDQQALVSLKSLMVIRGVSGAIPQPGSRFTGPDVAAGLQLARLLVPQPYAAQIADINMKNFRGRVDSLAPQIVLDTVYGGQVWWGRAVGDEGFYEIPAASKLKALSEVYYHYGRIDAGKAYVDIRTEEVKVPRILPGETTVGVNG